MALRSTSAYKTGRNLPLDVIDEECLYLANPDVPSDQREAKGLSPATDVPPVADEPIGNGSPPQGSTAATPFALKRDTHVPEGTRSSGPDKETPPAPPTLLTTPFFVDALKTPSEQAGDDLPTLSRRTGQGPLPLPEIYIKIRESQQRPSQANASPPRALGPKQDK